MRNMMSFGLIVESTSQPMPQRSSVPGLKFSTTMSAVWTNLASRGSADSGWKFPPARPRAFPLPGPVVDDPRKPFLSAPCQRRVLRMFVKVGTFFLPA